LRILYVDLETQWRGGQSQALLTTRGLITRGHDVKLVAIEGGDLARRARTAGVPVVAVRTHSRRWQMSRVLKQLLNDSTIEIVHANEPHALTAAWLAKAHRKSKLVFSRRVAYPIGRSWIARQRYFAAARIFAISHFVANSVMESGIAAEKIALIYEGVEVPPAISGEQRAEARTRWQFSPDEFVFASIGYLLPEKGHEHLVRAFAEVSRSIPQARLILAGDGPERRRLEALSAGVGLREKILFAGIVERIMDVYAAADAFVFPSLAEPLGTSMLAAMANGLAVIWIASAGVPEYVEPGVSGLLAREASAASLAPEMTRIAQNAELRTRLGAHAREHIRAHFSADVMVENTIRGYEKVLTG